MTYLKVLLIRHAESTGNGQGIMEGQTSTELSRLGQQQCKHLSQALTAPTEAYPTHLYSSPLLRAQQTSHVLSGALASRNHSLAYITANALQEIHQGIFQGLTWAEAETQFPDLCKALIANLNWQPVPQAETLSQARARAHRWLRNLLAVHHPGETIWAVSHAGIMQQLIALILGCDRTWKIPIHHTGIFEFWLAATNWESLKEDKFNPEYWIIRRFNDCSHL